MTTNPTSPVASVSVSSELIEDYFPITPSSGLGNTIVAVADDSTTPATPNVLVVNGASIVCFSPDPTSASGWTSATYGPLEGPILGIHAFFLSGVLVIVSTVSAPGGNQVGINYVLPPPATQGRGWGRTAWQRAPYPGNAQTLVSGSVDFVAACAGFGHAYVIAHTTRGATSVFYLPTMFTSEAPSWIMTKWQQVQEIDFSFVSSGGQKVSFGGPGSKNLDALHPLVAYAGSVTPVPSLQVFATGPGKLALITLPADLSTFQSKDATGAFWIETEEITKNARSVVLTQPTDALGGDQARVAFLLEGGGLYGIHLLADNWSIGTWTSLTAATALTGCFAGDASSGHYCLFALDTSRPPQLWTASSGSRTQDIGDDFTCLGDAYAGIAAPPVADVPTVFGLGTDHSVSALSGEPWETTAIGSPGPPTPPAPVRGAPTVLPQAGYAWQLTARDAVGNALPGATLTLSADQPMLGLANGEAWRLDPDTAVPLATDGFGRLLVRSPAASIVAPALYVAEAGGTASPLRADAGAHGRLAAIDGATLVSNGFIDASLAQYAEYAAQVLQGIARLLLTAGGSAPRARAVAAPVLGRLSLGNTLALEPLTEAQWQAIASQTPSLQTRDWDSFAHWVEERAGDVVSLGYSIGDQIVVWANDAWEWTLSTLEDIGAFAELFIDKIAGLGKSAWETLQRWLAWLRELFHWDDVRLTKEVVAYLIDSMLTNAAGSVEYLQSQVHVPFDTLADAVTQAFADFRSLLVPNQGVGYPSGAPPPALAQWGTTPDIPAFRQQDDAQGARSNYLWTHIGESAGVVDAAFGPASADLSGPVGQLGTVVGGLQQGSAVSSAATAWTTFAGDWVGVSPQDATPHTSSSDFFSQALLTVLDTVEDLIQALVSGAEELVEALLELLARAITAFQTLIETEIDIPIFSWLTGLTPSALDIFSWAIALPLTVGYKLMSGNQAPFTSAEVAALTGAPVPWPPILGAPARSMGVRGEGDRTAPAAFPKLIRLVGCAQFGFGVGIDIVNVQARMKKWSKYEAFTRITAVGSLLCDTLMGILVSPLWSLKSGLTAAQTAALYCQWLVPALLLTVDIACCVAAFKTGFAPLIQLVEAWGPWACMVFGAASLGVSIWAAVETNGKPSESEAPYGWLDWLPPILASLTPLSKPLVRWVPSPALSPQQLELGSGLALALGMFDTPLLAAGVIAGCAADPDLCAESSAPRAAFAEAGGSTAVDPAEGGPGAPPRDGAP